MVRDFQSVIGREARAQVLERFGRLPTTVVACVGGGSNAMGIFTGFIDDPEVALVGVEAAGEGIATGHHSATLSAGPSRRAARQPELPAAGCTTARCSPAHSVSAGLDYPGVGPEHSWLRDSGRVRYDSVTDREALDAFRDALPERGDHPRAGDGARARLDRPNRRRDWRADDLVLLCLSGRGDKDVAHVAALLGGAA